MVIHSWLLSCQGLSHDERAHAATLLISKPFGITPTWHAAGYADEVTAESPSPITSRPRPQCHQHPYEHRIHAH